MARPYPRILHPVKVVVEQIDRVTDADAEYDEDYREPIDTPLRQDAITLQGQAWWGKSERLTTNDLGPEEHFDGYVLFSKAYLDANGITLAKDDKITHIGGMEVNVFIVATRPRAHYPEYGYTQIRAYFEDRQPVANGG